MTGLNPKYCALEITCPNSVVEPNSRKHLRGKRLDSTLTVRKVTSFVLILHLHS